MEKNWVSIDGAEDVAGSLRHALRCIDFVDDDPQAWKWVILAVHSALQGACVCHLLTTAAPVGAMTEKNKKEWLEYFNALNEKTEASRPDTKLMPMNELLKAIRKSGSGNGNRHQAIKISDSELQWLTRIHKEFRNQFIHFAPVGWSFEVSGIPKLCALVARIIEDILNCGWAFRHFDQCQRDKMVNDLERLRELPSVE